MLACQNLPRQGLGLVHHVGGGCLGTRVCGVLPDVGLHVLPVPGNRGIPALSRVNLNMKGPRPSLDNRSCFEGIWRTHEEDPMSRHDGTLGLGEVGHQITAPTTPEGPA